MCVCLHLVRRREERGRAKESEREEGGRVPQYRNFFVFFFSEVGKCVHCTFFNLLLLLLAIFIGLFFVVVVCVVENRTQLFKKNNWCYK